MKHVMNKIEMHFEGNTLQTYSIMYYSHLTHIYISVTYFPPCYANKIINRNCTALCLNV